MHDQQHSQDSVLEGYEVARVLRAQRAYLAKGAGRVVVLKRIEEDCLMHGQLHPSIKERLARVRELAHGGVANLHGVERGEHGAFLVWEYVEGKNVGQWLSEKGRSPREAVGMARDVVLAVEALHALGIVHGNLHGGNVIVDARGQVRLTDISPLLHDDPMVDARAVVRLLRDGLAQQGGMNEVAGVLEDGVELRALASKLIAVGQMREVESPRVEEAATLRRRPLIAAAILVVLGLGIAYGVYRWVLAHGSEAVMPAEYRGK